jgi:reductive dehalogenase
LGASLVGIADYDERWVYTHSFNPFTQAHVPIEFPVQPKSVVVIAIEMNYLNYRTNPSFISSAATAKGYGDMAIVAYRVATFIRALGYHAFPCHNDIALSVPLAIQAGLGEMSRLGLVVTPEYGPRVRLCKVFTDMPLEPDRPITFGVVEFCKKCMKCADVCPARAISNDPEPSYKTVGYSNNPGVKKWYNKLEGCLKFWADKVDCAACIAVCPYNKPNNLTHQLGLRIAQTPARGLLRRLDSLLGYGKTFDKKLMRNWWPVNPLDQSEASERPRRVTDENDLGWIKLNDTTRLPEVLAALNVKLNSQPERLAGVNMTVQFVFTGECGGPRYLLIRDSKAEISEGHNTNASTTITVKDSDFLLLIQGKLSPLAIVSGRVKVEGDMSIIPKFRNLMR